MKSSDRDKAEGKVKQVKGNLKEAVGELTGDESLETEGKIDALKGKAQEKRGEVKKVFGG